MIDYDKICKRCRHYEFDLSKGILCGLTKQNPAFEGDCKDFTLDFEKEDKLAKKTNMKSYSSVDKREGMSTGEWIGVFVCTPYGLIKFFSWKKEYPRKSKQVCIFYLIAIPTSIIIRILLEASSY